MPTSDVCAHCDDLRRSIEDERETLRIAKEEFDKKRGLLKDLFLKNEGDLKLAKAENARLTSLCSDLSSQIEGTSAELTNVKAAAQFLEQFNKEAIDEVEQTTQLKYEKERSVLFESNSRLEEDLFKLREQLRRSEEQRLVFPDSDDERPPRDFWRSTRLRSGSLVNAAQLLDAPRQLFNKVKSQIVTDETPGAAAASSPSPSGKPAGAAATVLSAPVDTSRHATSQASSASRSAPSSNLQYLVKSLEHQVTQLKNQIADKSHRLAFYEDPDLPSSPEPEEDDFELLSFSSHTTTSLSSSPQRCAALGASSSSTSQTSLDPKGLVEGAERGRGERTRGDGASHLEELCGLDFSISASSADPATLVSEAEEALAQLPDSSQLHDSVRAERESSKSGTSEVQHLDQSAHHDDAAGGSDSSKSSATATLPPVDSKVISQHSDAISPASSAQPAHPAKVEYSATGDHEKENISRTDSTNITTGVAVNEIQSNAAIPGLNQNHSLMGASKARRLPTSKSFGDTLSSQRGGGGVRMSMCSDCQRLRRGLKQSATLIQRHESKARDLQEQLDAERAKSSLDESVPNPAELATQVADTNEALLSTVSECREELQRQAEMFAALRKQASQDLKRLRSDCVILVRERDSVQARIEEVSKEVEWLSGRFRKHADACSVQAFNLPTDYAALAKLTLELREEMLALMTAKDRIEEKSSGEIGFLKQQLKSEEQMRSKNEEALLSQMSDHEEKIVTLESIISELERKEKDNQALIQSLSIQASPKLLQRSNARGLAAAHGHPHAEKRGSMDSVDSRGGGGADGSCQDAECLREKARLRDQKTQVRDSLNTSEQVQQELTRFAQSLQYELEKVRSADTGVRLEHADDVTQCGHCKKAFERSVNNLSVSLNSGVRTSKRGKSVSPEHSHKEQSQAKQSRKVNCSHCGKIMCCECTARSVAGGKNGRLFPVCPVCYTILKKDSAPYFSEGAPDVM